MSFLRSVIADARIRPAAARMMVPTVGQGAMPDLMAGELATGEVSAGRTVVDAGVSAPELGKSPAAGLMQARDKKVPDEVDGVSMTVRPRDDASRVDDAPPDQSIEADQTRPAPQQAFSRSGRAPLSIETATKSTSLDANPTPDSLASTAGGEPPPGPAAQIVAAGGASRPAQPLSVPAMPVGAQSTSADAPDTSLPLAGSHPGPALTDDYASSAGDGVTARTDDMSVAASPERTDRTVETASKRTVNTTVALDPSSPPVPQHQREDDQGNLISEPTTANAYQPGAQRPVSRDEDPASLERTPAVSQGESEPHTVSAPVSTRPEQRSSEREVTSAVETSTASSVEPTQPHQSAAAPQRLEDKPEPVEQAISSTLITDARAVGQAPSVIVATSPSPPGGVQIGQVDVFVEAAPVTQQVKPGSAIAADDQASRHYLRRL